MLWYCKGVFYIVQVDMSKVKIGFNITYLQIKLFSVSFLSIFPLFPQYPAGVLFIDTLSRVA